MVRLERTLDFGAGRARNAAAAASAGEILVFLDADVIPERQVLESYARWFQRDELVLPMGICHFVDVDEIGDDELVELVRSGGMAVRHAEAAVDEQLWRERHFERTRDLRDERVDAFRVTIGATVAVARRHFEAVGGFPELGVRGVEDTAFGFRMHNEGGVLILDRDAQHWHQGRRSLSDDGARRRIDEVRAPYVASVMPVPGFRVGAPPEQPPVAVAPFARIVAAPGNAGGIDPREAELAGVDTASVRLADGWPTAADDAFVYVDLPAGVVWGPTAIDRIGELFRRRPVGVVKAIVEGSSGDVVTIVRTRALRRAHHVRPDADPVETAAELFGQWYVVASSLDLRSPHLDPDEGAPPTVSGQAADGPEDPSGEEAEPRDPVAVRVFDAVTAILRAAAR